MYRMVFSRGFEGRVVAGRTNVAHRCPISTGAAKIFSARVASRASLHIQRHQPLV
jgi:hypothetical protein